MEEELYFRVTYATKGKTGWQFAEVRANNVEQAKEIFEKTYDNVRTILRINKSSK